MPGGDLPIDAVLGQLVDLLERGRRAVVAAEPGSGKTTRVPLAIADAFPGRVLVLEPRRVAARSMAGYLARTRGEAVGASIGLTTRDERKVSEATRVEFVTEGVLTRRLQRDPQLRGVTTVVFDEFHERSLAADVGLALSLDVAAGLREDLRIVVMSATLDHDAVATLLDGAPVVRAAGRSFEVETLYRPVPSAGPQARETAVVAAIAEALADTTGDVLVFLAGAGEIRRTERRLVGASATRGVDVLALHGQLSPSDQDRALAPAAPGRRKVVLATNVAETSLTVQGVTAVVDSGMVRRFRDGGEGRFGRLMTERTSQAEADQRRGRAGRLCPGRCYRLWTTADHAQLRPLAGAEILNRDLSGLALELAAWGVSDASTLRWLDPPPTDRLEAGRVLDTELGLLDGQGRPTPTGRSVLELGLEPRLGAIVVAGRASGKTGLRQACRVAALIEEGDFLDGGFFTGIDEGPIGADLNDRLDALEGDRQPAGSVTGGLNEGRRRRVRLRVQTLEQRARRLPGQSVAHRPTPPGQSATSLAALLLAGMADRIAQQRDGGGGRYRLRHGGGVQLPANDPLGRERYLVILDAGGFARSGPTGPNQGHNQSHTASADLLVRLAAPLPAALVPAGTEEISVRWSANGTGPGDVVAQSVERLDELVVSARDLNLGSLRDLDVGGALLAGIRRNGLSVLGGVGRATAMQRRIHFCRAVLGSHWPDVSDAVLLASLEEWLTPFLVGVRRRADLGRVDLSQLLWSRLDPPQQRSLDRLAPSSLSLPGRPAGGGSRVGRKIPIDYEPERPMLAVKLQELFGLRDLPRLADGAVRLVVQLLSPAGRPIAITDDLERFWTGAYQQVRSELRGRYPKHAWPEDPLAATPSPPIHPRPAR